VDCAYALGLGAWYGIAVLVLSGPVLG